MIEQQQPAKAADLYDAEFFRLASECTVEAWLNFLGHRWSALILYHLSLGAKRFGELAHCLPTVTPKMMTERLLELQRRGLVDRDHASRDADYRLTPRGEQLMPILNALEIWARPEAG
ncbi:winged helix-turn-helix transcriptional regulator [Sphingopyxis kveilinensis]|uniref:winged helix-turn-helix transcriptional regulator n=1 Tax=Sphingopyxis kveilinensis TaxID=3114367 RepID=UPI0030CE458D